MQKNNQNFRRFRPRSTFFLPLLFSLFILIFAVKTPAFADQKSDQKTDSKTDSTASSEAKKLSSDQAERISASCSALRTSLKNLQRSDSRARTYFGAIYETVSSKYLTPLNLRLVKNDLSDPDLISAQTSLASLRTDFSSHFIAYSKSLEDLINTDCRLEPDKFYSQLLVTREERALVATDMQKIDKILTSLPAKTVSLQTKLKLTEKDADQD